MSLGSTETLPGGDARRWISFAAAGALACALSPILPLLSLAPWEVVTVTPYVAVILATVTLVATRGRTGVRGERTMAVAALAALAAWVGLFVLMCLALLYGG